MPSWPWDRLSPTGNKGGDMTVGLTITFSGGAEAQYRPVHSHMRTDENPLRGLILHSEGPVTAVRELGDRTFVTPPTSRSSSQQHYQAKMA